MGSTRLPKKSIMLLGGKPLLQNVFERDGSEIKNPGQIPTNEEIESISLDSIVDSVYLSSIGAGTNVIVTN